MTDPSSIPRITTRQQMADLADRLGVRPDWSEPDNQGLTASVHGIHFDNAGHFPIERVPPGRGDVAADLPLCGIPDPRPTTAHAEIYATLLQHGKPVAMVNLATLCALAAGHDG